MPMLDFDVGELGKLSEAPLDGLPGDPGASREGNRARPTPAMPVGIGAETREYPIGCVAEAVILDGERRSYGEPA